MILRRSALSFVTATTMAVTVTVAAVSIGGSHAFAPVSPQRRHGVRQRLTSSSSSSSTLASTTEQGDVKKSRPDLPDYGTTPIEIDQIHLNQNAAAAQQWSRQDLFGTSLVDQTVADMDADVDFQDTVRKYATHGAAAVSREERALRRRALGSLGIPSFESFLQERTGVTELRRKTPTVLQLNVGLYCNQACGHCHVESSPIRTEMMTAETAAQCLALLAATPSIHTLDLTGGAPELNDSFRYLVATARQLRPEITIIDRCNLTVLQEPGQEDLVEFLSKHRVRIVASLPCYSEANVDEQRGNGVFERSIAALLALNDAGYGKDENLPMDLVYNPSGAFLPPEQGKLQEQYKIQLADQFGILFNDLFTMTNMPVKRFADFLHRRKELVDYMELLVRNFNDDTVDSLMCRDTVSVGYDGKVFDCDFNQQLGYGIDAGNEIHAGGLSVFDLKDLGELSEYAIRNDNHCFGCTAGMGSS